MGIYISRVLDSLSGIEQKKILMLGLDAAGKTTILFKLKLGDALHTIPTIGFNVEQVKYKKLEFTIWDVGGQDKIRALWRHYFDGNDALIFVVDAQDTERIDLARETLEWLLGEDQLRNSKLLVFANKQDLPGALTSGALAEKLGLSSVRNRWWYIQSSCAVTGEGLYEGLDSLSRALNER
mmetsp:Transcript_48051/g.79867  ORF Transcript_48051/g.79867 Transcript_48051/m.79867 type:complete len:181 (-) Transcript_48051:160-702(-)